MKLQFDIEGKIMLRIFMSFLICLILTACGHSDVKKNNAEYTVSENKINKQLYFTGILNSNSLGVVSAPLDGVISEMKFSFGQPVKKGDVLMVITSDALQKEYNDALTEYLQAKDSAFQAESDYKGSESLWDLGIISENDYKNSKSHYHNAMVSFIRSQKNVERLIALGGGDVKSISHLALSDLDQVKEALNKTFNKIVVKALCDGYVFMAKQSDQEKSRTYSVGMEVKRGDLLLEIDRMDSFLIPIYINEVDLQHVKINDKVEVRGSAFPGLTLQGEIATIDAQAKDHNAMIGAPSFAASVLIKGLTAAEQKQIRVGMSVEVTIRKNASPHLLIPIEFVTTEKGTPVVLIKTKQGIKSKDIRVGDMDTQFVEVLSGLTKGDVIVYPSTLL